MQLESEAKAVVAEIARGGLAELHTHLGGSVDPAVMWSLAHEQGIALPVKDYWDFVDLVTVDPRGVKGLPELDAIYKWTELIQSSPLAVERSVHGAIGGAYISQNITTLELRFNPMKRNRGGERDLDHIIMAAVRGLDRAFRLGDPSPLPPAPALGDDTAAWRSTWAAPPITPLSGGLCVLTHNLS